MFVNRAVETRNISDRLQQQNKDLQTTILRAYKKTVFYKERLQAHSIDPDELKTIGALSRLPFLTDQDLTANHPFGLLTAPVSAVARLETTADQTASTAFTKHDLLWQVEMIARGLVACNITMSSVLLLLQNDLPSAVCNALQQGAEAIGATVIAASGNDANTQIRMIFDYGVTSIFAAPSSYFSLADFLSGIGYGAHDLALQSLLVPEPTCDAQMRSALSELFKAPLFGFYGQPNFLKLGIASACHLNCGLHLQDDHVYAEIIDPSSGAVLPAEQAGELVLTTLSREVMPLLRYRTGITAKLIQTPCSCGRTSPRLAFL